MLDLDKLLEEVKECRTIAEQDVQEMCLLAQELLIEESNIQKIDAPVVICGDIHGQLHDLLTLFEIGKPPPDSKYLFLGDFVDRGFYSLETFLLLLIYKLKFPNKIYLIRGNHESRQITSVYGFYDECIRKYNNANVWRYCCELFDYLSLGAYILSNIGGEDGIFCVHGGLSPNLDELDEIRLIDRKQEVPHDGSMCDLLWSDPEKDIKGWALSPRGAGYLFGEGETSKFLHKNGLSLIARAHQLVMEGYRELFDGGLVTVWSAPNYCYRCGNVAAVLRVNDGLDREYTTFESSGHNPNIIGINRDVPSKKPIVEYFL
jgi:serine/threonine-protein phosphatase 4 catalytic subunit